MGPKRKSRAFSIKLIFQLLFAIGSVVILLNEYLVFRYTVTSLNKSQKSFHSFQSSRPLRTSNDSGPTSWNEAPGNTPETKFKPATRRKEGGEVVKIDPKDSALFWNDYPIVKGTPHWQRLDNKSDVFLYSAHYDDIDSPAVIRVVGLARDPLPYRDVCCRFYAGDDDVITRNVSGTIAHFRGKNGRGYLGAFVVCPVTKDASPPFAVGVDKDPNSVQTTYLIVHYSQPLNNAKELDTQTSNRQETHTHSSDKGLGSGGGDGGVDTEVAAVDSSGRSTGDTLQQAYSKNWNITRCFPAFQRGYGNYDQVAEMIATGRILGVDHFVFYVESANTTLKKMLQKLKDEGLADVYPWNMHLAESQVFYTAQFSAIQDCLYRHLHSSRYLLFGDADELFVPRSHDHLLPLLDEHFTKEPECGAFLFMNTFFNLNFPTKFPPMDPFSVDFIRQHHLSTLLHPTRHQEVLGPGVRSKPAVDPRKILVGSVHVVERTRKGYRQCKMDPQNGLLHHYRRFGLVNESERIDDAHLWRFADSIVRETRGILNRTVGL